MVSGLDGIERDKWSDADAVMRVKGSPFRHGV